MGGRVLYSCGLHTDLSTPAAAPRATVGTPGLCLMKTAQHPREAQSTGCFYSLNRNIHLSDLAEVQFTELRGKLTCKFKIEGFGFFFFTNITNVHPLVQ